MQTAWSSGKREWTIFSFDSVCWEDGQSFLDDSHSKRKKANAFPVYIRLSGWYKCKMIASSQLLIKTLICWIPNELQLTHYLVVFNVTLEPRKLDENCLNSDNYGGLFLSLKLSRIISSPLLRYSPHRNSGFLSSLVSRWCQK